MTQQCQDLQKRFAEAAYHCCQKLEKSGVSFEEVRKVVTDTLYPRDICEEAEHMNELFATDHDIDDMFETLTKHGLWDCQNYLLLKSIITKLANENEHLHGVLRKYEVDLTCYQKSATTFDACDILGKHDSVNHSFRELTMELGSPANNLHYVTDLTNSLVDQFCLVPELVLLRKVTKNPFTITWFVPALLSKKVTVKIPSNQMWLEEKSVVCMKIGEKVLYKRDNSDQTEGKFCTVIA